MNSECKYKNQITKNNSQTINKSPGDVVLLKRIIDRLNIEKSVNKILKEKGGENKYKNLDNGQVAEILCLNRLIAPKPMYNVAKWAHEKKFIGDIHEIPESSMNDDRICEFLDVINPHLEDIWNEIINTAIKKYNLSFDTLFNDITSSYFEGEYTKSELNASGLSRNKRFYKKHIELGVNSNLEGIPLSYSIFKGNTAHESNKAENMAIVEKSITQFKTKKDKATIVVDRAMLDDKIILGYSNRKDVDYLGMLKLTDKLCEFIKEIEDIKYVLLNTKRDHGLFKAYRTSYQFTYNNKTVEETVLVYFSESKALHDKKTRDKFIKSYIKSINDFELKLNKTIYKKLDTIEKKVTKLARNVKGAKYVDVAITQNREGNFMLKYSINQKIIDEESKLDGKYIIATNNHTLTNEEIFYTYKQRNIYEKDFSLIKGPLQLPLIFLKEDTKIESLIFIIMLSLLSHSLLKMLISESELNVKILEIIDTK
ncbi:IS1634 family transposase [Oceanirhabdus sp. W0125-5]|uniref:IS1634 family transposase n=1 Tax=Oceanirhabdus sp. W0125-5 TaxID=2999116 RepID=UPI0022F3494F|nr:IS1634 family transposase [Oceanirhabdus sp. W0125-5]WBW96202.1 IS1634 family transposase [Oceanirhabdus sp. W0125-5]